MSDPGSAVVLEAEAVCASRRGLVCVSRRGLVCLRTLVLPPPLIDEVRQRMPVVVVARVRGVACGSASLRLLVPVVGTLVEVDVGVVVRVA